METKQQLQEREKQEREMAHRHTLALKTLSDDLLAAIGKFSGYCDTVTNEDDRRFLELVYARMMYGEAGHAFIELFRSDADSILKNLDVARDMMLAGLATAASDSQRIVSEAIARGTMGGSMGAGMLKDLHRIEQETLGLMSQFAGSDIAENGPALVNGAHRRHPAKR